MTQQNVSSDSSNPKDSDKSSTPPGGIPQRTTPYVPRPQQEGCLRIGLIILAIILVITAVVSLLFFAGIRLVFGARADMDFVDTAIEYQVETLEDRIDQISGESEVSDSIARYVAKLLIRKNADALTDEQKALLENVTTSKELEKVVKELKDVLPAGGISTRLDGQEAFLGLDIAANVLKRLGQSQADLSIEIDEIFEDAVQERGDNLERAITEFSLNLTNDILTSVGGMTQSLGTLDEDIKSAIQEEFDLHSKRLEEELGSLRKEPESDSTRADNEDTTASDDDSGEAALADLPAVSDPALAKYAPLGFTSVDQRESRERANKATKDAQPDSSFAKNDVFYRGTLLQDTNMQILAKQGERYGYQFALEAKQSLAVWAANVSPLQRNIADPVIYIFDDNWNLLAVSDDSPDTKGLGAAITYQSATDQTLTIVVGNMLQNAQLELVVKGLQTQ